MRIDDPSAAAVRADLEPVFVQFFERLCEVLLRARDGVEPRAAPPSFAADHADAHPVLSGARRIVAAAHRLGSSPATRVAFGRTAQLRSVNPAISGDYRDHPKCNVFAGDVLYSAGYRAPTCCLAEGGEHYLQAEGWPRETDYFDKVTDPSAIRPGDVLVIDWRDRAGAEGGAHVEVITGVRAGGAIPDVTTMGARTGGLAEDATYGAKLAQSRRAGDHFVYEGARAADLYVLRPKEPASVPAAGPLRG